MAVRRHPDSKDYQLILVAPLGVHLPAGLTMKLGDAEPKAIAFLNCDSSGCLAEYTFAAGEVDAFARGVSLTLWIRDRTRAPISVTVPSEGFALALATVK
jgi:invasion protein IalB